MTRRLPPLNALRAFEAAARHLSFKAAAAELGVTPAAVGHQVRALEAQVGRPLFRRLGRTVALTSAGTRLLPGLSDGFDRLAAALRPLQVDARAHLLTVSVAPSLAARWLVPRLDGFREAYPEITVRFDTAFHLIDFEADEVDIAVRFVGAADAGQRADQLFNEIVVPACSPDLLEDGPRLTSLADLAAYPLLNMAGETTDSSWPDWSRLFAEAGVAGIDPSSGPSFNQSNSLIAAAVAGQGVALVPLRCAVDELAEGRLLCPFGNGHRTVTDYAYFMVTPEERVEEPKVAAFRDWILQESERHVARLDALRWPFWVAGGD